MKFAYAPESTPLPGYKIKRAIDRGGFGEVYFGIADSGKEVALKLLQHNQQIELRGIRQCLNLKHPNLVALFDIRTDAEGDDWVVMEYVAGPSLDSVLSENPNGLPLPEVDHWLRGISEGVAYLHDRGIVHRDLKPGNVFSENGIVKVGDVGLSKFITPSRRSAQTESVGTVYYMAPEVARGKYGCELDVYSLGVMLYEMISGKLPFDGESVAEILMKHLTEHPDLSRLPAPVRPVVARALEKDPQRRTPGVLHLAREFQGALRGEAVALEIPESHFVDVVRLEIDQSRDVRSTPIPVVVRPETPGPKSQPVTRPQAKPGFWEQFGHELKTNPVLIVAIVVTCIFLFPVMTLGSAKGVMPVWIPGFSTWFVIGALAFWVNRKRRLAGQPHNRSRTRPQPPLPPRRSVNRTGRRDTDRDDQKTGYVERRAETVDRRIPEPVGVERERAEPVSAKGKRAKVYGPETPRFLSWRDRTRELCSALTLAVVWSIVLTSLIGAFQEYLADVPMAQRIVSDSNHAAFFIFTTILGAWAVIVPAKLTEGHGEQSQARWVVGLPLAAAVGFCVWWLQEKLLLQLRVDSVFRGFFEHLGKWDLTSKDGSTPIAGYLAFFVLLFGMGKWWTQADSFRLRRLSIWTVAGTAAFAWLLPLLFRFNQPWGVCWGAAISVVVQLSSPWTRPADRAARVEPVAKTIVAA